MDLINDLFGDDITTYTDTIESGKTNAYYEGQANNILKQFDNDENYFHFLLGILENYPRLSDSQKETIKEKMNIQPTVIEKVVYKQVKQKKSNSKPTLNTYDDY
jgi:nitrogenase subunit NifH